MYAADILRKTKWIMLLPNAFEKCIDEDFGLEATHRKNETNLIIICREYAEFCKEFSVYH